MGEALSLPSSYSQMLKVKGSPPAPARHCAGQRVAMAKPATPKNTNEATDAEHGRARPNKISLDERSKLFLATERGGSFRSQPATEVARYAGHGAASKAKTKGVTASAATAGHGTGHIQAAG